MFVGRKLELEGLEKQFAGEDFELSLLYGRTKVGKTYLIRYFIKDKPGAYFISLQASQALNLQFLSQAIYQAAGRSQGLPMFKSFDQAFRFLFEASRYKRIVFVIDDFPYLAELDASVSSSLQQLIQEYQNKSQLMLILSGSSISFMEQVMGVMTSQDTKSPTSYFIQPFTYLESALYLKDFSDEDAAILHGVTGGVAEYLTFVDPSLPLGENIEALFLKPNSRFYREPLDLMRDYNVELRTFNDILLAMASGSSGPEEIASKVRLYPNNLNHYMDRLISLGIIERLKPVGQPNSHKIVYRFKDFMFAFYYRFVMPNMAMVEMGQGKTLYKEKIEAYLDDFMGPVFEIMGREFFEMELRSGRLNFEPREYGHWWGINPRLKQEEEIDLLALAEGAGFFAEFRWRDHQTSQRGLKDLMRKSELFDFKNKHYWLFSKAGFNFDMDSDFIRLISLEDMMKPRLGL